MGVEDCWLWTGSWRTKWGHGRIGDGGRNAPGVPAHRIVFEQFWGPVLPSEVVRHVCDVPLCCNPWHLEPGSPADNVRDQYTHGAHAALEV